MKTLLKLTIIILCLSILGCKNDKSNTSFDYKYTDTENVIICNNLDTKLIHEALLSFEDDILNTYNTSNKDVRVAYTTFFRTAQRNQVNYQELVSPHTMKVFEALKSDSNLWVDNKLNYTADIFTCIGENLKDKGFATTYKALISTNSMRSDLIGAPLQNRVKTANTDRYLATFIALEYFFSKLDKVDKANVTKKVDSDNQGNKSIIDAKSSSNKDKDSHAGHNHD